MLNQLRVQLGEITIILFKHKKSIIKGKYISVTKDLLDPSSVKKPD